MAKVYIDDYSRKHVVDRIKERIHNTGDQEKIMNVVKKLLSLNAPIEAVGHFQWHINVETIGRIVLQGHSIRTILSFNENFPGGTQYKIVGNNLIKA
jgi:hypothetical protein